MTGTDQVTNEQPAESTTTRDLPLVDKLDEWVMRHPRFAAGAYGFFALVSAVGVVLARSEEPMFPVKLAITLGWTLLFVREVRRAQAHRS